MTLLTAEPSSFAAFIFLALAIASLWVKRSMRVWGSLLGISSILAVFANRLSWPGILFILGFFTAVHQFYGPQRKLKSFLGFVVFALGLALGSHFLPGFRNWKVLEEAVSLGVSPFPLYLNFDKAAVGLLLLALGHEELCRPGRFLEIIQKSYKVLLWACIALLGVAYGFGAVRLDLKWPMFAPLWLAVNLFFVCIAEEAFFRGFVQTQLTHLSERGSFGKSFRRKNSAQKLAWFFASVIFGIAHYKGGLLYVGVATLAGLFYGAVFRKTQRIEASIFVHFAVNSIHFLAFTYPFQAP